MKLLAFNLFAFTLFFSFPAVAQTDTPVFKGAIKANRERVYSNIVKNSIIKNLGLPLTDSTEENWEAAFYAMELLNYKQPWMNEKIKMAFDSVEKRSDGFQRALMELMYTNYKSEFKDNIDILFLKTLNAKVFAMCGEYLLRADRSKKNIDMLNQVAESKTLKHFIKDTSSFLIGVQFLRSIMQPKEKIQEARKLKPGLLLNKNFLNGNTIVYSIQRKNRDFPGLVIVRDSAGNFIHDGEGNIFFVPQLARSITNLPGYLTNGNTPTGIFRMYGFDVSKSAAIGPTENIQLTMPLETSIQHFLKDSSITDTVWTSELYERLLPPGLKGYYPLYQTFFASTIGRTEIISHGTTVDPVYYTGQAYYPLTPTQGCLCTKEIWSDEDGKRTVSDQQKLIDAVKKAGGADGYLIVIEIDDQQKPVDINEILPYLKNK